MITLSATSACQTVNANLNVDTCSLSGSKLTFVYSSYTGGAVSLRLVNNFKNPVNRKAKSGFIIEHLDQEANIIADTGTTTLSLANNMNTATTIGTASGTFGANMVSTSTSLTISINYPIPTEQFCFVQIDIPTDIPVVQSSISGYQGTGFFNNDDTSAPNALSSSYITWPSAQRVRIEACKSATNIYTSTTSGPVGTFTISNLQVPNQVKATDVFTINTYQTNTYDAANLIATGTFIIPASAISPGSITLTSWTPMAAADFKVQYTGGQYTIIFTPQHSLYSSSKIIIVPPTQVTSTTCTYLSGNGQITGTPTCTKSLSGWELTNVWTDDGNALSNDYIGANQITVSLGTGINPISVQPAGSWTVETRNLVSGAFYQVDTGTLATSFTTTPGTVSPISITAVPTMTSAQNGVYTFSFNTDNSVPASGIVQIIFPSSVSLLSTATCTFQDNIVAQTAGSCSQVTNGIRITVTTQHLAANNPMQLRFGSFLNPRTFEPSGSFTVTTMDSSGNMIDTGSGFSLTMNTRNTFTSFSVTRASEQNGVTNTYTISFTSNSIQIRNGDILKLTFPPEISLTGNACSPVSQISALSCSRSGQTLTAQLTTLTSNTGTFQFSVASARNPTSFRPSSDFTNIIMTDQNNYDALQFTNSLKLTDSVRGVITASSLSPTSYQSSTSSTFGISFVTTNAIGSDGSIVLHYPQQITVAANAPCQITVGSTAAQNNKCTINTISNTITITNAFAAATGVTTPFTGSIAISIQGTTPSSNQNGMDKFYFTTYDDSAQTFDIDELTQVASTLTPQLECNYPCKTCNSVISKDFCTTCYPALPYLQVTITPPSSTCKAACDPGYSSNGSNPPICVACGSTCETCEDNGVSGDRNLCVTCLAATNFKYGKTCQSQCPTRTFDSGAVVSSDNICADCNTNCLTCSGSAVTCTSCDTSTSNSILFNNQCTNSCPSNYIIINNACVQCTTPCQTCSGSVNSCVTCIGGFYKYGNQCYNPCPAGTTTDNVNMVCLGCQTGCNLCDSTDQTKCLTCATGFYYFDSKCYGACPSGYQVTSPNICTQLIITPPKPEVVSYNNTIYIQGETKYVYVNVTNSNGTIERVLITNTTLIKLDLPLIYFPHLIAAAVMTLISIGGYCKDRTHLIIPSIIALCGPIELLSYAVQGFFSYLQTSDLKLFLLAAVAFAAKLVINFIYWLFFLSVIKSDPGFEYWRSSHVHGSRCIACSACTISFKLYRFFYNNFYGFDSYKAYFEQPKAFQISLIVFSCMNMIFSYAPILFADVSCLSNYKQFKWGTQLYITLIETAALSIYILILTIIEFFKLNGYLGLQEPYNKVKDESVESQKDQSFFNHQIEDPASNELERKLREEMLRKIMSQVKGNHDLFLNNKLDELLTQFGDRKCQSMGALEDNDKEDDPREVRSLLSPRSLNETSGFILERPVRPLALQDNVYAEVRFTDHSDNVYASPRLFEPADMVYAEAKLPDPLGMVEPKEMNDMFTQVDRQDGMFLKQSVDLLALKDNKDNDDDVKRIQGKNKRRRGRKSQYYHEIDAEDEDQISDEFEKEMYEDDLAMIREIEEEEEAEEEERLKRQREKDLAEQRKRAEQERKKRYEIEDELNMDEDFERQLYLEDQLMLQQEQERRRREQELNEKEDIWMKESERLKKDFDKRKKEEEMSKSRREFEANRKLSHLSEKQRKELYEAHKKMLEAEAKRKKENEEKNKKENDERSAKKLEEEKKKQEQDSKRKSDLERFSSRMISPPPKFMADKDNKDELRKQKEEAERQRQEDIKRRIEQEKEEKKQNELRKKEMEEKEKLEEAERKRVEEEEKKMQAKLKEKQEEEERKKAEDEKKKKQEEKERLEKEKQEQAKLLKLKEEEDKKAEKLRLEEEEKKRKEQEKIRKEEEKKKQLEEEQQRKAEEKRKKEEEKQRIEEEKRKQKEEEQKRKDEEKKQKELEKQRLAEEKRLMEEEKKRKKEEDERIKQEQKRQQEEEKKKKKEEEERKRQEEKEKQELEKKQREEEKKRKQEEEKQRQLEEKLKKEEEQKKKEEEERQKKEEEKQRKEAEKKQKEEEETQRKEQELLQKEQERKQKEEQEKQRREEEKKKLEQEEKMRIEEEKRKLDEEKKRLEEEKRKFAEERKQKEEEALRLQQEKKKQEEEALKNQEEKKRVEEEERKRKLEEKLKQEELKQKMLEEDRKRKEDQMLQQQELLKKMLDDEKKHREEALAKQESLKKQMEDEDRKRKQQELERQEKLKKQMQEEEEKRKDEEKRKQEIFNQQMQELEYIKKIEDQRRQIEDERRKIEAERRAKEEEKIRQAEEQRFREHLKKMAEIEERKLQEQQQYLDKKKSDIDNEILQKQQELKKESAQNRKQIEEELKQLQQQKREIEDQQRQLDQEKRKLEDEKKRLANEKMLKEQEWKQYEEDLRQRSLEQEFQELLWQTEMKKREDDEKRRQEQLKKDKEQEEKRRKYNQEKNQKDEEMRREEEDRRRKIEEQRLMKDIELRAKEEEKKRFDEEKRKMEQEWLKQKEEEKKLRDEAKRLAEEEREKRLEQEKQQREQEKLRQEELQKLREELALQKQNETLKQKEEEQKRLQEIERIKAEFQKQMEKEKQQLENERKKQLEEEKQKLLEQEQKRLQQEQKKQLELQKQLEEQKQKLEEEKRKQEEEKNKLSLTLKEQQDLLKQKDLEKQRQEEEQRLKLEEIKKQQNEEKQRLEQEQQKLAEQLKQKEFEALQRQREQEALLKQKELEAQQKLKEDEQRRKEEEKQKKEEEKQRKEEEKRKREEEIKRKAEEEKKQKEQEKLRKEEEKKRLEQEKQQKLLEEKQRKEEERKKKEEERKQKEEEERQRKENEKKRKEEERKQKEEELRQKREEERLKKEEEQKQKDDEIRRKKEEQERLKKEQEDKKKAEQQRLEDEQRQKREQERLEREAKEREIQEKLRLADLERTRKIEEEQRQKYEEQKKREEEAKLAKDKKLRDLSERREREAKLAQEKKEKLQKEKEEKEQQLKMQKDKKIKQELEKREKLKSEMNEKDKKSFEEQLKINKMKSEAEKQLELEQERLRRLREGDLNSSDEENQNKLELDNILQKLEEEKEQQENEENRRKQSFEEEVKKLEDQITQEIQTNRQPSNRYRSNSRTNLSSKKKLPSERKQGYDEVDPGQPEHTLISLEKDEPIIQHPPQAEKRNFNENDILGEFDQDDRGGNIILTDMSGNKIDKHGRRVNEKGYLIDPKTGDVVDNLNKKKMFDRLDLDQNGELPAPFNLEKNNFNPHNIRGDVEQDVNGIMQLKQNKQGQLVDKKGRRVNNKGYLVDEEGNIIDKHGRRKFNKRLLSDEEEMPKLYNYNGRRFEASDVAGFFDQDTKGNSLMRLNKKGELIDNFGRRVNEKGYLIDNAGNIIDKRGKKIFEKRHLKNGEIPKILPFTKFNVKNVQGDYEMDPLGVPILERNRKGETVDRDGNKVNQKGFLVDDQGNVVNKQGRKIFSREILDEDGNIPKIFRTGILKSDSLSSFSKLMSEIERGQDSEFQEEERIQREMERLQAEMNKYPQLRHSRNSSVDSLMADTPSNYNIANQRYENIKNQENVSPIDEVESGSDDILDELDELTNVGGVMRKKPKKKKKKLKDIVIVVQPGKKELQIAKAYGGEAKPHIIHKLVPVRSRRSKRNQQSQSQLSNLQNSVSQFELDRGGVDVSRLREQFNEVSSEEEFKQNFHPVRNVQNSSALDTILQSSIQQASELEKYKRPKIRRDTDISSEQDFEQLFGKDVNRYLDNSDNDIESIDNGRSHLSRRSMGSENKKLRNLEKNYLQRLGPGQVKDQPQFRKPDIKKQKPQFRSIQGSLAHQAQLNDALDPTLAFLNDSSEQNKRKPKGKRELIENAKKFL